MRVAGVDGCYGGWLVAQADVTPDGLVGAPIVSVVPTFGDVLALGLGRIVVDIPIGLPDTWVSGQGRVCDRAARVLLAGPRASSVFAAPPRAALELVDWDDPRRPATGMSRQAFAILPKIREVDAVTRPEMQDATAGLGAVVLESHPEVIFRDLNGGRAVPEPKRTAVGAARRRALLGAALGPHLVIPPAPPGSRTDDVLDGLACLWVAAAPVDHLDPLGGSDGPPRDTRGLQMAIWRRRPMRSGLDT